MDCTRIPCSPAQYKDRFARAQTSRLVELLSAGALVLLAWGTSAQGQQVALGEAGQSSSVAEAVTPVASRPDLMPGVAAVKPSERAEGVSAARLPTAEVMQQQLAAAEQASLSLPGANTLRQTPDRETGEMDAHRGDVTVHGHWVIEVRRKDGTLGDRREFENSYIGGDFMGLVLSGISADIDPAILVLSKTNGPGSWCNGAFENECTIFNNSTIGHGGVDSTPSSGLCILQCYTGLTSTLMPDGAGGYNAYVLNATITAIGSGTFDTVESTIGECYNNGYTVPTNLSSANCYANAISYDTTTQTVNNYNNNTLTGTTFGGPMTVTAGETVTFTVTISFS